MIAGGKTSQRHDNQDQPILDGTLSATILTKKTMHAFLFPLILLGWPGNPRSPSQNLINFPPGGRSNGLTFLYTPTARSRLQDIGGIRPACHPRSQYYNAR